MTLSVLPKEPSWDKLRQSLRRRPLTHYAPYPKVLAEFYMLLNNEQIGSNYVKYEYLNAPMSHPHCDNYEGFLPFQELLLDLHYGNNHNYACCIAWMASELVPNL
jgi:hypothetical protein